MAPVRDRRPVTKDLVEEKLRYDPNTGFFVWKMNFAKAKIGDIAGSLDDRGYVQIGINRRLHYAHRLAWLIMTGSWPTSLIDHKNTIKSDNRWENLREATCSQNLANKTVKNPNGARGVTKSGSKFVAQIQVNGKARRIGTFDTLEEAANAYKREAEKEFGEYVRYDHSQT